jgi:hypothetical protein
MMRLASIAFAALGLFACVADSRADDGRETYSTIYAEMDGELVFFFDRKQQSFRLESTPRTSARAERLSGEYGDCSTPELVCFDFDEFMLAIPKSGNAATWSQGHWRFRRSACLSGPENACRRYAVMFTNDAGGYDGGFVFGEQTGVEMFHHASRKSKRKPLVYVLQDGKGLLSDGRP